MQTTKYHRGARMVRRDRNIKRKLVDIFLLACICGLTVGLMSCAGVTSAGSSGGGGNPGTGTAPVISGVSTGNLTATSAGITWTTDIASSSQVNYGTTAAYGQSSAMNSSMVTSHSTTLSSLTASTLYHYQVISRDTGGNQTASADFTFTTTAASAPVISAVTSGSITSTGATITWTTDVGATSQVNYGTTTAYGQSSALNSSLVTSHSVALSGLTASTLYHFQVVSKDTNGTPATSSDFTFTTTASTTPPTISAVTAGSITSSGATITWTTDVGATSQVNYGTTTAYGQSSALNSSLVTSHSVALSGLTASTLYHYQVVSKNSNGNQATSGDFTFTTASSTPPVISAVTATAITVTGATITWTTNVGATSQVNYGPTTGYGKSSALNSTLVTSHSVALSGLAPSTLIHFQVVSKDGNGNQATSGDSTLTTLADTIAPSVPQGLAATAASSTQINLTWTASTDDVAVTGYNILRGGSQVGTSKVPSYSDTGLTASTSYTYTVAAFDAAGNTSAPSASASATTLTQGSGGGTCAGGMPCTLGWYSIPNTSLSSLCPNYSDIQGTTGCAAVTNAWGSALVDTRRNRLILHGGGHVDYRGNEIYAIDFNNLTSGNPTRVLVKDASHGSAISNIGSCPEAFTDGTPNSRHDYNGLWYLPVQDQYWLYGAGLADCGNFSDGQWAYSPASGTWTKLSNSTHPNSGNNGSTGQFAYDSVTDSIYDVEANTGIFWQYTIATNAWTQLATITGCNTDNGTSAIDPVHRLYLCVGSNEFYEISLNSPYAVTNLSAASGCSSLVGAGAPGFAFDGVQQKFVGYNGGNSVYVYDPVGKTCSTVTYTGGPTTVQGAGTYGRFAYMPGLGGFVYSGSMTTNIYFLRLIDPATAALTDFNNRSTASGVIVYEGFDSAARFAHASNPNTGIYPGSDNSYDIVQDTSVSASGGSSLRFPIKANDGTGNTVRDDNWLQTFCQGGPSTPCTPTVFNSNVTFYVQYRYRVDANYVNTNWELPANGGSSPKISDLAQHSSSCGETEMTTNNRGGTGRVMMYGECGQTLMGTNPAPSTTWNNSSPPYQFQSSGATAGYGCAYNSNSGADVGPFGCYTLPANTWVTFYCKYQLGAVGASTTNILCHVLSPGQQSFQWLNVTGYTLHQDMPGFDAIWFNVYMTNFSSSATNPAANAWLDEVIVSTSPIAAPQAPPVQP